MTSPGNSTHNNSTRSSGTKKGSRDFTTRTTGILATADSVYRTIPKGGVILPRVRLSTMTTPKCRGLMPKVLIIGTKIGVRIVTETIVDIKHPTTRKNRLIINKSTVEFVEIIFFEGT